MRRSGLLLICALLACAGEPASARQPRLAPPRYFADPANRSVDIESIRRNLEGRIAIAGHYSRAFVPCGTGCSAMWVVDRRTGAIIEVPPSPRRTEAIFDMRGGAERNAVNVIYGPADGVTGGCRARTFRLTGVRFRGMGGFSATPCP